MVLDAKFLEVVLSLNEIDTISFFLNHVQNRSRRMKKLIMILFKTFAKREDYFASPQPSPNPQ